MNVGDRRSKFALLAMPSILSRPPLGTPSNEALGKRVATGIICIRAGVTGGTSVAMSIVPPSLFNVNKCLAEATTFPGMLATKSLCR